MINSITISGYLTRAPEVYEDYAIAKLYAKTSRGKEYYYIYCKHAQASVLATAETGDFLIASGRLQAYYIETTVGKSYRAEVNATQLQIVRKAYRTIQSEMEDCE